MNDAVRTSIAATLAEIEHAQAALGLPVDEGEFCEAWEIVCRLERTLLAAGLDGDRRWSPRSVEAVK